MKHISKPFKVAINIFQVSASPCIMPCYLEGYKGQVTLITPFPFFQPFVITCKPVNPCCKMSADYQRRADREGLIQMCAGRLLTRHVNRQWRKSDDVTKQTQIQIQIPQAHQGFGLCECVEVADPVGKTGDWANSGHPAGKEKRNELSTEKPPERSISRKW